MTHSKPIKSTASVPTIPPPFCLNKKSCKTSIEDSYKPSSACNQILTLPGFRDGNTLLEKFPFDMKVDRLSLTSKVEDSYDVLLLGYQDTGYFARTHKKNLAKVANLNTGKQKKTLVDPRVQRDLRYDFLRSFSQFSI
jgi:hypothetical protein